MVHLTAEFPRRRGGEGGQPCGWRRERAERIWRASLSATRGLAASVSGIRSRGVYRVKSRESQTPGLWWFRVLGLRLEIRCVNLTPFHPYIRALQSRRGRKTCNSESFDCIQHIREKYTTCPCPINTRNTAPLDNNDKSITKVAVKQYKMI